MIILPDNEMHQFAIRRLMQTIAEQQKKDERDKTLKTTYYVVLDSWSELYKLGINDNTLYAYKCELEAKYYNVKH
jgi:hypothetical protein